MNDREIDELIDKTVNVINSCRTQEQLDVAHKYTQLVYRKLRKAKCNSRIKAAAHIEHAMGKMSFFVTLEDYKTF